MQVTGKRRFEQLVELGMPASAEMERIVENDPELARDTLAHCKKRFSKGRKPVDNPGGYIVAFLRDPSKFGFVFRDRRWTCPGAPSRLSDEEVSQREAARKAANEQDSARRQAEAEKAYSEMKDTWSKLPEEAKSEIRDFVTNESPLLHGSGSNKAEFELQCMNEATSPGRTNWLRRQFGLPPLKSSWASKRG